MNSSPPTARDSAPPALPQLAEAGFHARALDESVIFFCVDDAPREACRTESLPNGGLAFRTALRGRIERVGAEELVLAVAGKTTRVRFLLPSAVDLASLVGHQAQIDITQQYAGPGRATIDAQIRDAKGRLLLWARDGRVPPDRSAQGLALRTTVGASDARRLAVAHTGGVASMSVPDLARVRTAEGAFELLLVRLGAEDISFVLVRR
jgi:hypothetical protein